MALNASPLLRAVSDFAADLEECFTGDVCSLEDFAIVVRVRDGDSTSVRVDIPGDRNDQFASRLLQDGADHVASR